MKSRYAAVIVVSLVLQFLMFSRQAAGDQLRLNDGQTVQGIVKSIDKGQVNIEVNGQSQTFDILKIAGIDFESPNLTEGTPTLPAEHFRADMEAKEMATHVQAVEESATKIRSLINQTKKEWADRKSIPVDQTVAWTNAKERLYAPLSRYQESLNDLYFHVLGKVDEYNQLMKDADSVYVGVQGWFNAGSSLIPSGMEKLPLKKYVPGNWYDTIFFEGYDRGYNDAVEKYRSNLTSNID
jgi:hypothetical protein